MLQFISSKDGSPTIFDDSIGECYHSRNGALSESKHVFIQHGLEYLLPSHTEIRLLEVGLGTGLNALLSWNLAEQQKLQLHYSALEPYPVPFSFLQTLALSPAFLDKEDQQRLLKIHQAPFEETLQLSLFFSLFKSKTGLEDFYTEKPFHLVYFDAFSPKKTPHLWVEAVFEKLCRQMYPGGVLVTYCAKGSVKRILKKAGFRVEALPGAMGKREMTRALKQ